MLRKYKAGSVGSVLNCCKVQIRDKDQEGIGEIWVSGDNVMQGYYDSPEDTQRVLKE